MRHRRALDQGRGCADAAPASRADLGASKRHVTYGGQPLAVDSWADDQIITQMPEPPPSGNVQVVIGNHQSEEVPLTEWDMPGTGNVLATDVARTARKTPGR